MHPDKISRHYRNHRRGPRRTTDLCLRCFQLGHRRGNCTNDAIVGCGNCFRAYYFTTGCVCNQSNMEGMTLRMVGGEMYPRPCIDLLIANRPFEALINQSTSRATINMNVLDHINNVRGQANLPALPAYGIIQHQIQRRNKIATVDLEVKAEQTVAVIAGMEVLMKTGFELRVDNVKVNERSPVLNTPRTVDFLYNLQDCRRLRNWMRENHKPMYNTYTSGEPALLQEEPRVIINNQEEEHNDADILELHANEDDLDQL